MFHNTFISDLKPESNNSHNHVCQCSESFLFYFFSVGPQSSQILPAPEEQLQPKVRQEPGNSDLEDTIYTSQ